MKDPFKEKKPQQTVSVDFQLQKVTIIPPQ